MADLKDVARDHAAYNIAWGLRRLLRAGDDSQYANEGAHMLKDGIVEVLEILAAAQPEEKPR